jgi:succinoglycan biosynthesis protein ExoO
LRRSGPEAAPQRSELITLGGQGASGADSIVPDYVPAHLVDWSVPRRHSVWRALAVHANARCIALDKAGQYAAGFIPEVTLETREALQVAS